MKNIFSCDGSNTENPKCQLGSPEKKGLLEAGEYLPSGKLNALTNKKAISTLNQDISHQVKSGETLAHIAKSLGINPDMFVASLLKNPEDLAPKNWENKKISYKNGQVSLENGTQFPVVPSHLQAKNDEHFRQTV